MKAERGVIAALTVALAVPAAFGLYHFAKPKSAGEIAQATPATYTLTIFAEDIASGRARSSGGASFSFTTSKVSVNEGKIVFDKGGSLRLDEPINGTTLVSFAPSSTFSNSANLTLNSGYVLDSYGASAYLTKSTTSLNAYYRTYFSFSSDNAAVEVDSLTLQYQCQPHYQFTPIMNTVTENVSVGVEATYGGLAYQNDIGPNLDEVDIVKERFTVTAGEEGDGIYAIHPIAKFYDKGGCLIKQSEGFWVCHVNPIIRFHTSKDRFTPFAFEYNSYFDLDQLTYGALSGYDWREYTLTASQKADAGVGFINDGDGVLTQPLTTSLDLYPKVWIDVNPGGYSSDSPTTYAIIPNPNAENFGFPDIADPSNVADHYHFKGYLNGDDYYDPATADDFHDLDLYADYNSDFDLRLRFINRGFDNPYLEKGIPDGDSFVMPDESSFIDQSGVGVTFGHRFVRNGDGFDYEKGYLVYPEGNRMAGEFYATGSTFTNNGLGTMDNPATYVAEPYTMFLNEGSSSTRYLDFETVGQWKYGEDKGLWFASIKNYYEHRYFDGKDEKRTYFKKFAIPDSMYTGLPMYSYASIYCNNGGLELGLDHTGITQTQELEVLVGNEMFARAEAYGFSQNHALKRLEFFPHLYSIGIYAFYECENLLPMQQWEGVDNVTEIGRRAFGQCFVNPIIDANKNIKRRTFVLPSKLEEIGACVFEGAVYTDFFLDPTHLTNATYDGAAFDYSPTSGKHSADFATALARYEAAFTEEKPNLVPSLKAVSNRVYFQGSRSQYETLLGSGYDELSTLLEHEYYVIFEE